MTVTVLIMPHEIVGKIDCVIDHLERENAAKLDALADTIYAHEYNKVEPSWFARKFRGAVTTEQYTRDAIRNQLAGSTSFFLYNNGGPDCWDYEEWRVPTIPYYHAFIQLRDIVKTYPLRELRVDGVVAHALNVHWVACQARARK